MCGVGRRRCLRVFCVAFARCAFWSASSTNQANADLSQVDFFVAWFSAGVRVLDLRDPYALREIRHYIPATNKNTRPSCPADEKGIISGKSEQHCKTAIVTNAVGVDDRGYFPRLCLAVMSRSYVYMVYRNNTGRHIVELSGAARLIANFN